jgi:cytochrome b6-f complex iron-sulfur subunit
MNQMPEIPENKSKRDFLQWVLAGGVTAFLGAVLYPIFAYLIPPKQAEVEVSSVKAGKLSEMEKESGKIIKFGTKPVILIRTANDEVRAFSATCTHLDCTVQFRKDFGMIWCACHNGKYDLNGRNVSGPPPRPLDEFRVLIQGDEILISKKT